MPAPQELHAIPARVTSQALLVKNAKKDTQELLVTPVTLVSILMQQMLAYLVQLNVELVLQLTDAILVLKVMTSMHQMFV